MLHSGVGSDSYSIVITGKARHPRYHEEQCKRSPNHHGLQECCCLALGNLCNGNDGSLIAVKKQEL
jgi:hypothetical protein